MRGGVDIRRTVRARIPAIPFADIARRALGKDYSLSLLLCGDALARRINAETRKKTYAPNVLSFPLGAQEGEILLNVRKAEREARAAGISLRERLAFLFVHGTLHLGGMDHGRTMEYAERRLMREYTLSGDSLSRSTHAKSLRRH